MEVVYDLVRLGNKNSCNTKHPFNHTYLKFSETLFPLKKSDTMLVSTNCVFHFKDILLLNLWHILMAYCLREKGALNPLI